MARSGKLFAKKDAPEEHPESEGPTSGASLRPVSDVGEPVAAVDTAVETEATTRQPAEPSQHGMLGELLVGRNLISHSQLAEALLKRSASGKRLGFLLVDLVARSTSSGSRRR